MNFDKLKIGKLISIGGEHIVYHYGDSQVIKYPNWVARLLFDNRKLAEKKQADLLIAKKYLADYLLTTDYLVNTETGMPYYLIQPHVNDRSLTSRDFFQVDLRSQFLKIYHINEQIKNSENMVFDFFGAWRLLFYEIMPGHEINNLRVVNDSKIMINDFSFLEYQACQWSKLFCQISRWAARRQTKLLKNYINL